MELRGWSSGILQNKLVPEGLRFAVCALCSSSSGRCTEKKQSMSHRTKIRITTGIPIDLLSEPLAARAVGCNKLSGRRLGAPCLAMASAAPPSLMNVFTLPILPSIASMHPGPLLTQLSRVQMDPSSFATAHCTLVTPQAKARKSTACHNLESWTSFSRRPSNLSRSLVSNRTETNQPLMSPRPDV
jgi:hypothetical protein